MIAALFVEAGGAYFGLTGVDPWDIDRDATMYKGPHPVIVHPPCTRWCRLAGLVEARYGYKQGDDGGTFAHALDCVRRFGGVLEHPAWSKAWPRFGLINPDPKGGWTQDLWGGWVCHVEQGQYGHLARKATWLYVFGTRDLPELKWGTTPDSQVTNYVSWCGNNLRDNIFQGRPRLSKKRASSTPVEFRDVIIDIARRCNG